ncbi:MAG: TetR/AcrR family transcriptional regulator [Proteobacteria bacterium]|nr:TetR/AcrR family transcriptional regulator [Pseudomonadota bacterium]
MTSKTPTVAKPPRRTQESRSAETRAKLLAAAIQSLHARGYAATTTMVVAADAGVSRGAMLHQFPTKVDLMLFVVETVYQQELVLYRERLGAIEDPRERLLSLPEVAWEVLSRPEGVAVLEVLQGARSDVELARRLKPLQIAIEKDSFQAVDRVAEAAGIVVPPVVKRLMVWSVRGLSIAELLTEEPGEMIKSVRLLRRLMALGIEMGGDAPLAAGAGFRVRGRVKTKETTS